MGYEPTSIESSHPGLRVAKEASMNLRRPRPCLVLAALIIDSVHYVDSFSPSPTLPPARHICCGRRHRPAQHVELRASNANEGFIEVPRHRRSSDGLTEMSTHRLSYRVVRPMALSSRQAAPILALHGGPSIDSSYLYHLEDVVEPVRSIVFYDQLGCGRSDEPKDVSLYSIEDSVRDLKALLKKLGVRRFHLYGQSYGGILAFEYMKSVAMESSTDDAGGSSDVECECLSAILSSAPTNIAELEKDFVRLYEELSQPDAEGSANVSDAELDELFRKNHQCRLTEMPAVLQEAYDNAGTVWSGIDAIAEYVARPPPEGAARMPSTLIMRGAHDFVSEASVNGWKDAFNTPCLRFKTLEGCSHHGLFEKGSLYGGIVDSYFGNTTWL